MNSPKYILLTAARDEEDYIEKCLRSVLNQTVLPREWVIVDDASRDATYKIVELFARKAPFINLLSVKNASVRNFGSKALAINFAYENLRTKNHEYVGVLDADVSFQPDYYEKVFLEFGNNPELGIGGGREIDFSNGMYIPTSNSRLWSVSGPVQLFRRQCFEQIGGYMQLPRGGVDAVAEVMARMNGWRVQTFENVEYLHHRAACSGNQSILAANFRIGIREYAYGTHPLFEIGKSMSRIKNRPFIIGALVRLAGYIYACLSNQTVDIPEAVLKYTRKEQMKRLLSFNRPM